MAIRRGEIYFVKLGPARGREQAGERPVLVLSIDRINALPLVVTVVPGTDGANIARDHFTNVRVPVEESGLSVETIFLCFQLRSLDAGRFPERAAGEISGAYLERIEDTVRYCLGL